MLPQLQDAGHEVAISAFWGLYGRRLEWNGMPVYPGSATDYGDSWLPGYASHWGGGSPKDVQVITLLDVWTLKSPLLKELNMACWCPVDHDPLSAIVAEFYRRFPEAQPIAMSKFGKAKLEEAGLHPEYAPHGVDTLVMKPYPQAEIREANGLPKDAFVVGMVANNKGNIIPRKAFPQVFEAFAEFAKRHDDAFLYLHSDPHNQLDGLDLTYLAKAMGVPLNRTTWTPPLAMQLGIEQATMAGMYSTFDVLACPSYGEGFGIPIIEAQACGVPVIVQDFSAMPELVGHGWMCEGVPIWDAAQGSYFSHPSVGSILECLEEAYKVRGGGSEKARAFAEQYETRLIFEECWKPILARLEERMAEKGTLPAVTLTPAGGNRAMRRRARAK